MDMSKSSRTCGTVLFQEACELAAASRRLLRHSDVFRAAEYAIATQVGEGAHSHSMNKYFVERLGEFSIYDQDVARDISDRRDQMARTSKIKLSAAAAFVRHQVKHETSNPVVLHHLKLISDSAVGPRADADAVNQYIRRASRKLHPDKCKDLEGWQNPKAFYSLNSDRRYEQAKWGAEGLFELHQSLKELYASPYYAKALYEPSATKGGSVRPKKILAEVCTLSALICVLKPQATSLGTVSGAIIGILWLMAVIRKRYLTPGDSPPRSAAQTSLFITN